MSVDFLYGDVKPLQSPQRLLYVQKQKKSLTSIDRNQNGTESRMNDRMVPHLHASQPSNINGQSVPDLPQHPEGWQSVGQGPDYFNTIPSVNLSPLTLPLPYSPPPLFFPTTYHTHTQIYRLIDHVQVNAEKREQN